MTSEPHPERETLSSVDGAGCPRYRAKLDREPLFRVSVGKAAVARPLRTKGGTTSSAMPLVPRMELGMNPF